MNYYPHHIGDFNSATRHLTRIERSVYRDMIELYYDTEQPLTLDLDMLCRKVIARSDEERTAVQQALNEFFQKTDDGWHHERCDLEIQAYRVSVQKKSAAGKASAAKRATRQPAPDEQSGNGSATSVEQPSDERATNQEPRTKNQVFKGAKAPSSPAQLPTTCGEDEDVLVLDELDDEDDQPAPLAVPPCPHRDLIALYAQHLPELTQPRVEAWDGARAEALKQRWRWVLMAKRADGSRYATTPAEALEWFGRFFTKVSESDFLMGRTPKPWTGCDLAWLSKRENFVKVIEGRYDNKE